ncbi:MAG: hypothetical protein ACIAQF_03020 [Phycisphaerales bacterium JB065]
MKVFWAILLGSFMIASAIVFRDGQQPATASRPFDAKPTQTADSKSVIAQTPLPPEIPVETEAEPSQPAPAEPVQESASDSEVASVVVEPEVESLNLDELLGIEEEPNRITPEMAIEELSAPMDAPRTLSQQATAEFAELALQASGTVEEATRLAGSISPDDEAEVEESGLKIGKVTIPGRGTEADPYELPWGVLISAIRTYNPRLELNELPTWADELNDRYVRLTGFAFLPVVASETDEILLMLNPWDGCHMGAPPTPYDSVEVMLNEPVSMGGRNGFVTVTGRFNVDPYLLRGWLVSLYTMDEARLEFAGN